MLGSILIGIQFFFSCVVGLYFLTQLKGQSNSKSNIYKDSLKRSEELEDLRKVSLTKPLSEKVRPQCEEDIIGQEAGMKALKIALCGPRPQHILIYGSPGVGNSSSKNCIRDSEKFSWNTI